MPKSSPSQAQVKQFSPSQVSLTKTLLLFLLMFSSSVLVHLSLRMSKSTFHYCTGTIYCCTGTIFWCRGITFCCTGTRFCSTGIIFCLDPIWAGIVSLGLDLSLTWAELLDLGLTSARFGSCQIVQGLRGGTHLPRGQGGHERYFQNYI